MEQQIVKVKNKKGVRVIPGFGLSMGVTLAMLGIFVLIPLASIFLSASQLSFGDFVEAVTSGQVVSGYIVSLSCAFLAALINAVLGLSLAWVLVRYDFPGKRLMDGLIELPFALPTAVAGISLTYLYSDCLHSDRHYHSYGFYRNTICGKSCTTSLREAGCAV